MTLVLAQRNQKISSAIAEYGQQLMRFVRGRVDSVQDAEDLMQEVWFQLSRTDVDALESVSAWLYRVARNKITDLFRQNSHKPQVLSLMSDDGSVNFGEILLGEPADADEDLFREMFWEQYMKALDELPANQRLVFVENEIEGKTLQQIADEQNENLKTVISRKGYAVKHLRLRLNELYRELNNS